MRFLSTRSYELYEQEELPDDVRPSPPYAILSHTWLHNGPEGVQEVTYQDMKTSFLKLRHGGLKRLGWSKLVQFCSRAALDGWDWAWMDTCCIDKTNPADTEEAINAMFRWYQDAGICYAYLSDLLLPHSKDEEDVTDRADPRLKALERSFCNAVWFTRGWTLQELLAPDYLVFVDQQWRCIGLREAWAKEIETASRIKAEHLRNFQSCSLAMKLSWASLRRTSREEDEAYSLLGLFGISMPLVYGEGRRAFIRFQRELIKTYDDESLFIWKHPAADLAATGVLSPSIRYFEGSSASRRMSPSPGFSMTNQGLHLTATIWKHQYEGNYAAELNCSYQNDGEEIPRRLGIKIRRINSSNYYDRVHCSHILQLPTKDWERTERQSIIIRQPVGSLDADLCTRVIILKHPKQICVEREDQLRYYISMAGFLGLDDWVARKIMPLPDESDLIYLDSQKFLIVPLFLDIEGKAFPFCVILRSYPTFSFGIYPLKGSIYQYIKVLTTKRTYLMPSEAKVGGHALRGRLTPKSINHRQRANNLGLPESSVKLKEYELEIKVD